MALVFLLAFHPAFVLGQGSKITMEHDPVVDTDRDKPGEREQWFMRGRTRGYSPLLLPLMLLMIGLLQACGGGGAGSAGGGQPGTPPGNYSITVSAKSGSLTHTVSAALTVQ